MKSALILNADSPYFDLTVKVDLIKYRRYLLPGHIKRKTPPMIKLELIEAIAQSRIKRFSNEQ
jgi:hypothetical protein